SMMIACACSLDGDCPRRSDQRPVRVGLGGTAQALIGYAPAMFEGWDDYYLLVGSAASARTRRPFAAYLVRQPGGKIGFQFEAKAGAKGRGNSYPFVLGFAFPLGVA